ncbi:RNA polymerase sigma factor WhiG [candidate division KSB1 bacterium]|nr:MAG: RNA polymerase sigma factor WhiG [candidate division KSB1 bacterium]RKY88886.1 MAG: RNA polymerase sigma factor WhiG [candidate division KSB1 bacterium]RKY93149.1 MAG: RNA polymerase sigma factor WhiG [candidate division KSB1 bacterium]
MAVSSSYLKNTQPQKDEQINSNELWQQYLACHDYQIKEKIMIHYLPIVKYVVGRMIISLPNSVSYDDLVSAGIMGLISAIDRFNPKLGIKFETFVVPRIRGAILDELRSLDWVPRSVRSKAKKVERAIMQVESQLGRTATPEEVAKELNMDIDAYESMLAKVSGHTLLSLDKEFNEYSDHVGSLYDMIKNSKSENPQEQLEEEELKALLVEFINELPDNEKLVIALYYYEELTLKEIGVVLNISESRVSQIHTKAIKNLRAKLKEYL